MIPSNPIPAVCNYGASAVYKEEPSEEQIRAGVVPLDSLPAGWWNCMWYANNRAINCVRAAADSLIQEMNTVLTQAGVCPQEACYDQLYQAIEKIRTTIGTTLVAGAVKSSTTTGNVAIAADGTMSVNCLGTPSSLNTSSKQVVGAINELKTTYDCCVSALNTSITNVNNAKAPTSHASSATTYGVGNATDYGHLKISDQYTSVLSACSGVAASQKAVADAYSALNTAIGGKAPNNHASSATTYGVGSSSNYGHLKISDQYTSILSACSGVAASQKAVADAYSALNTAIGGKAPNNHASSATSYGVGSSSNYGHLKISDQYTSVLSACSGVAASQKAVADAYSALKNAGYTTLGNTAGCALAATGSAGTATTAARSDHVHPYPTYTCCACCACYAFKAYRFAPYARTICVSCTALLCMDTYRLCWICRGTYQGGINVCYCLYHCDTNSQGCPIHYIIRSNSAFYECTDLLGCTWHQINSLSPGYVCFYLYRINSAR